jgi:hypothetical protein
MQHAYNVINYIVEHGSRWGGAISSRVDGLENLTCLMNFLTLPIQQQLQERVHEVDGEDEW